MSLERCRRGDARSAPSAAAGAARAGHQARRQRAPFELGQDRARRSRARAPRPASSTPPRPSALAEAVGRVLAHRFAGRRAGHRGDPGLVEHALAAADHFDTARAYIVYRDHHARLRADRKTLVDVAASVNEYLDQTDWRVNANANQGYSLGGLILNVSGKVVANYWLSHVYAPEIGRAHREGDVHIHDLDMLAGYCAGWSLRTAAHEGLNGVPGKVEAGAAEAHVERGRPDRQLPRHAAERVGGRAGVLVVRHLHGAVHPPRRHDLRRRSSSASRS